MFLKIDGHNLEMLRISSGNSFQPSLMFVSKAGAYLGPMLQNFWNLQILKTG